MEKPSTYKPMNVLKTMVFLKNFMYIIEILNDKTHKIENIIHSWDRPWISAKKKILYWTSIIHHVQYEYKIKKTDVIYISNEKSE